MKIATRQRMKSGFTLVEIMVAMVILAIGLLGMAGMTILVIRGNKGADQITIATQLATQKMESLKDQGFANLGSINNAADTLSLSYGLTSSRFVGPEGPLNSLGEASASASPDYLYYRAFVVCSSDGPWPCTPATCTSNICDNPDGIDSSTLIPAELACDSTMAQTNEQRLRVVTYWKDRYNKCHRVAMDTIVVNLTK